MSNVTSRKSEKVSLNTRRITARARGTVEWLEVMDSQLRTEQRLHDETGMQDILNELASQIAVAQERLENRAAILEYTEMTNTVI